MSELLTDEARAVLQEVSAAMIERSDRLQVQIQQVGEECRQRDEAMLTRLEALAVDVVHIREDQDACEARWVERDRERDEYAQAARIAQAREDAAAEVLQGLREQGVLEEDVSGVRPIPRPRQALGEAVAETITSAREGLTFQRAVVLMVIGAGGTPLALRLTDWLIVVLQAAGQAP